MHFLRLEPLKTKLRSSAWLSQNEAAGYLTGTLLLFVFVTYPNNQELAPTTSMLMSDMTYWICRMLVTGFAILHCFKQNGAEHGRQFLDRFVSLSWVMACRFFVLVLILSIAGIFIIPAIIFSFSLNAEFLLEEIERWTGIMFLFITALVYFRVGKHISDVAKSTH